MRRLSQRAFTMVELLVAITAGLFVAVGAYSLAKQGSRFFQQEARIANAQFSATLGFDRLRADIARAGFLSTPNIQKDPFFCSCDTPGCLKTAGWPTAMAALAAVRIDKETPAAVKDTTNGLYPDQISLSGSYSSPEAFPVRTVFQNGTSYQLYLQNNNGPAARSGGAEGGALGEIFKAGRMLRILDSAGRYEFGEITGYSLQAGGEMQVILKQNPAVPFKRAGGVCGVEGFGVGMQANVVNWIRYEIRDLKASPPPGYATLYGDAATAAGDEGRFDLVRYELKTDGTEMDNSLELVAEYAVDLRFALTVVPTYQGGDGGGPTLAVYKFGDAENYTYGGEVIPGAPASEIGPNRIRSVRARLVVRSREADRSGAISDQPTGNIFRFAMGGDGGSYARARTLTADIGLPNLTSLRW
jgi:prepilin-type N-terminal cleavage/methylation domain-containing protein